MTLSGLDVVFLIVVGFAVIRAALRGFIRELLSMAALILGLGAAVFFSGTVSRYLVDAIPSGPWAQVVSFLGLFVVVYIVVKIFEGALKRLIDRVNLEGLDRALGLILGFAEGVVVVFILLLILQAQPFVPTDAMFAESVVAQMLLPLLPYAEQLMPTGA